MSEQPITPPLPERDPDDPAVLRIASFDPKVRDYWLWSPVIIMAVTVVLLPVAIIYLVIGGALVDAYLKRMSCVLTERSLEIKKGILNKTESTVPLEKITDLQMFQGPIMRHFGLHGFKVETAGQSAGPGGALVNMLGIVDTPGFRKAVLAQRDRAGRGQSADLSAASTPTGENAESRETVALLREIRDGLARIELHLEDKGANPS